MSRIIGVSGIHTDGGGSTDRLLDRLNGRMDTLDFNYDRVNLITARSRTRQRDIGRRLYHRALVDDHVVAHSYGALIVQRAMEAGAQFGAVFLFSPAMDSREYFPAQGAQQIHIISNPADRAIGLGALLYRHDFGLMGRDGYQGPPDDRVVDFRTRDEGDDHDPLHHSAPQGTFSCSAIHLDYFMGAGLSGWAQYVARHIRIMDGG